MEPRTIVRYGWLKGMYIWTILIAGFFGLGFIFAPAMVQTMMGYPTQDPTLIGISASVYLAFALASILGFFSPVKFAPVLLLQLCYKSIWFILVFLPAVIVGSAPSYGWMIAGIFATFIIGDLIAIPFHLLFKREP